MTQLMLATASIILVCVRAEYPQTGPSAQFWGLQSSFWDFGPTGGTDKHTHFFVNI